MPVDSRFTYKIPSSSHSPFLKPEEQIERLQKDVNKVLDEIGLGFRSVTGLDSRPVAFAADVNMQGHRITILGTPRENLDAAHKQYVDEKDEELKTVVEQILQTIHNELPAGGQAITVTRAVPTTVDDIIEIGTFTLTHSAHTFDIAITVSAASFSVAKAYTLVTNFGINSDWQTALPLFDTGAFLSQNFDLDVKQVDGDQKLYLRLRRTAGTTAGTATIHIRPRGVTADVFQESSATASVTAPTVLLESAILTVVDRRVGINTGAPLNLLHVAQLDENQAQLRLSDLFTPTHALFQSTANILNVDVLPADASTAAQIRMFRVTNTSGATTIAVFVGDGTATINAQIAGNGNTYFAANNGNVGIGSNAMGASALKVLLQATGTPPSSSPADAYQQYSADIVAGNAAPHFRTENGDIVKLFKGAALTASDGTLANAVTRIGEIQARLQALGLLT
jgi:hypothetical protein